MTKEDLAKIEKEIEKKLHPISENKTAQKQFRVDVGKVRELAERLERLSQKPDANPVR